LPPFLFCLFWSKIQPVVSGWGKQAVVFAVIHQPLPAHNQRSVREKKREQTEGKELLTTAA